MLLILHKIKLITQVTDQEVLFDLICIHLYSFVFCWLKHVQQFFLDRVNYIVIDPLNIQLLIQLNDNFMDNSSLTWSIYKPVQLWKQSPWSSH